MNRILLSLVPLIALIQVAHAQVTPNYDPPAFGSSLLTQWQDLNAEYDNINSTKQATDAELTCFAGLVSAADKLAYFTGSGTCAVTDFSAFARTLMDDANAATARSTLGLAIGSDVQAFDSDLSTLAGLTATTDNFIQSKASAWASRTPTQVTADLTAMVGDSGSGGSKGLVPAPIAGDATKFLRGDATWQTVSGGVSDGDKGDVTVSASGATWTIDNDVVTLAKMQNIATDVFLGRDTAGTGDPEELSVAVAKTLLNLAGTNSGDQTSIVGITGTKAQFDTAVTDGNFLYVGDITQYTDELAQDAIGTILTDGTFIDFTYNDGVPSITAAIIANSLTNAEIDGATLESEIEAVADLPDLQGVLTAAKGGTSDDTSATTGVPRISTGNWTYDAAIAHLAASTSADLAGVLSDEEGSGGGFVRATSPSITTPTFVTSVAAMGDTIDDFTGFGLTLSSADLGLLQTGALDGECLVYESTGPTIDWVTCGGGGGVSDGDKGDVVVSASGATWTLDIANSTVTAPDILDETVFADVSNSDATRQNTLEELYRAMRRKGHNYGTYFFTDFLQELSTTSVDGALAENNTGTGAASTMQAPDAVNHPGVTRSSTGTTSTGRAKVAMADSSILRFGGGEIVYEQLVNITTLSNATDGYSVIIGFIDTTGNVNQRDGAYFMYDERNASSSGGTTTVWQAVTTQSNTRTFNAGASGSSTVTANQWDRLKIVINAAGTQVDFYVNDTLRYSHTTNIPSGANDTSFGWQMLKSVGTAARTMDVDYLMYEQEFTTSR